MARIRTFKPDFFRHELLQQLEVANAELKPMLVFLALWGHCDKEGRFAWKPRILKLDILPFVPFDMEQTLQLLKANGFIVQYAVDGEDFGCVPTFKEHQRISGKEEDSPARYPRPLLRDTENVQKRSTREASGKHPDTISYRSEAIETTDQLGKHPERTWEAPGKHPESQELGIRKGRELGREGSLREGENGAAVCGNCENQLQSETSTARARARAKATAKTVPRGTKQNILHVMPSELSPEKLKARRSELQEQARELQVIRTRAQ